MCSLISNLFDPGLVMLKFLVATKELANLLKLLVCSLVSVL